MKKTIAYLQQRYCQYDSRMRAKLPADTLADIDAFNLAFKRHQWRYYGLMLLACLLATWLLVESRPRIGFMTAFVLSTIILGSFGFGLMSVWFGHFKFTQNWRIAMVIMLLATAGAIVGWLFGTWMRTGELVSQSVLTEMGSRVLIAGLATGAIYSVMIALTLFIRRKQLQERNALLRQQAIEERYARQLTDAKLKLLQAQVEPHFLFNTLASVQQLAQVRAPEAAALTRELITFLRAGLAGLREEKTTLQREFEMAAAYLRIMQTRMAARLAFSMHLPAELASISVPPAMLISLVENAIKHGIEPAVNGGNINVFARVTDTGIAFGVTDTGLGLAQTEKTFTTRTQDSGVGLTNIRERLLALYQTQATLHIEDNDPSGVTAIIMLPRDTNTSTTNETSQSQTI